MLTESWILNILKIYNVFKLNIASQQIIPYLFLNVNPEITFHHVDQVVFAAGIQHPLSDATLVPGHRINEDCKEEKETMRGAATEYRYG